jgi:CRISPR-associated protein Cas2
MFCVVAYDIPDDRRRMKLFKTMKGFGIRSQFSVFECELPDHKYRKMLVSIGKLIDTVEDNIKVYVLCKGCLKTMELMGRASITSKPACIVI